MLLYDREKGKDPCDYKMADGKPEFWNLQKEYAKQNW